MLFRILLALHILRPFHHLPGYMERYWIIKYSKWFPWSVRLHRILRSDNDRHLHDHPWRSISVILKGGYYERLPDSQYQMPVFDDDCGDHWRAPYSITWRRRATDRHQIRLPEGTDCWSLFFMGRYENDWGFYTPIGKISRRRYYAMQAIEKWFADIAKVRQEVVFTRTLRIKMTSLQSEKAVEQCGGALKAAIQKMEDITDYELAQSFPQFKTYGYFDNRLHYKKGDPRQWIGIPKEPIVEKTALYFGALNGAGHYLHDSSGRINWRPGVGDTSGLYWGPELMDAGLLKNGKHPDIVDGKVFSTCGGKEFWIAFFWWDRSADSRPNSNSGFYVRGFEWKQRVAAFDFACQAFPQVVARQKFSLVLQP